MDKPKPGDLRADALIEHGWTHGRLRVAAEGDDWRRFASSWNELVPDAYLGPARCRRNRRYGRVLAHRDGTLEPLDGTEFFQSKAVNRAFGDQLRVFEPLTEEALSSPQLARILRENVALVNEAAGKQDWELGIHCIRVLADPHEGSEPAPEGRHSDGHAYVAIHLIDRHQCVGGQNQLFRRGEPDPQYTVTMTEPLEVLLLSDTSMEHAVSEIRTADPSAPSWRDTLIVDFNAVLDPADMAGRTHRSLQ
ncbi:2OG-Fe dioxygenase family protein [Streptomyces violens]|uniref:2OG-Fe dioxygenase family protein n=1 Tax=Streptomyces violens TaxID=66377 RepID=UPI0004C000EA|nr:2OG-Fe dioxygenase family protein [Streptomyces violens]